MSDSRQSAHIPRSQLISMVADLRGMLYEVRGYLNSPDSREEGEERELFEEVEYALGRTGFDLSESDEVNGGFDQYHHEQFDPRRKKDD